MEKFCCILTLSLLAVTPAMAQPIAVEQFPTGNPANPAAGEYNENAGIYPFGGPSQNPTTPGFSTAWFGDGSSANGTGLWTAVPTGLDHPSIAGEAGGAALYQFDSEVGPRSLGRALTSPPTLSTGDTYWVSGLVSLNANDPDFDGSAYAGFGSDLSNDNGTQGLRFGVEGDGSEMDLVLRHRSGAPAAESLVLQDGISPGEIYHVLIKGDVNTDLGGGGVDGNDNLSVWVNPLDVSSEAALGAPTLEVEDFSLFNDIGSILLEGADITGEGVLFDELFLGQELSDVVTPAPVSAVPEPASMALWLLLGAIGAVLTSRRCRTSAA